MPLMDSASLTFVELLAGMLGRWRTVLGVAAAIVILALALTVVLPPTYRSEASFATSDLGPQLPPALSELATEPGISGLASQMGLGTSRDPSTSPAFYAHLLASRELLTRVVQSRFADPRAPADSGTLVEIFGIPTGDSAKAVETAVRKLRRASTVNVDRQTGFVVLNIDSRWADLSAEIANRMVRLVGAFNKEQRYSRARAKREFLETRVAAAQGQLRQVEDSLALFYERNRLWQSSPSLLVEERRRRQAVDEEHALYLSLRQQYEAARIDEVNNQPVITVVDRAVPPRRREWPHRALVTVTAALLGLGLGLCGAAARELASHWARTNPERAEQLRAAAGRVRREIAASFRRGGPGGPATHDPA